MKQILPLLLLIILSAGCLKKDYQYAIVCDFPAEYGEPSWLLVTDNDGNILKTFDIPELASQVTEKFNLDKDQILDTYNLHLVRKGQVNNYSYVSSLYGVKNGAAVTFKPSNYYPPIAADSYVQVLIKGVTTPDTLDMPGNYSYYQPAAYDAATQTAMIIAAYPNSTHCIVRMPPQPSGPFRSIILPTTTFFPDTLQVELSDFLPETDFKPFELPGNGQASLLEISAVEPDFKQCTTLFRYDSMYPAATPIPDRVRLPAGLNPQSLFRMRLQQEGFTTEKIFQPGEVLRLHKSDLTINAAVLANRGLDIQTSGEPDLLEMTIYMPDPNGSYRYWEIQAPPELCKPLILPDLTSLLPGWLSTGSQYLNFQVTAYQYDQLDYAQLIAGFPYKGGDGRVFPVARAGMQKVTKGY